MPSIESTSMLELAGKYLTFRLAEEKYGIPILKVREIIGRLPITPVPSAPAYLRGVINLRGKIIPVVDLCRKFGMTVVEDDSRTCIIITQVAGQGESLFIGVVVNEVSEVDELKAEQIEAPPPFGSDVMADFILGMGKFGDKVLILLDIDKTLAEADIECLQERAKS